jgi:hypothetical protein
MFIFPCNIGIFARIMVAFSFRHNWRILMDTDVPQDELSCLHGVRFVSSFMIFTIHKLIFNLYGPYSNRTELAHVCQKSNVYFRDKK